MAREDKPREADDLQSGTSTRRDASELFDTPDQERSSGADLLRRLMTVGFSGLFTTESAIRGALGDTVPREWLEFFQEQSDRSRDEFVGRLAQEFVRVLENVDIGELAEQMLVGRTIEVTAKFRLGPRDSEEHASDTAKPTSPESRTTKSGPTKSKSTKSRRNDE